MGLRPLKRVFAPVVLAVLLVLAGVAAIGVGVWLVAGLGVALIVVGVLAVAVGLVVIPT